MNNLFSNLSVRIILFILYYFSFIVIQAQNYNIGTYNIRCLNSNDTELKDWNQRKEFVAKTIIDNKFAVIGLQEISDAKQENDLKSLLPEYSIITWGRENASVVDGERVGIAYLTDKLVLLDNGYFFLAPNTDVSELGWDASHKRVSIWAKLQDASTGEIFFFCSTHLDNSGLIARREGARVNAEKMNDIARGYPIFIVGDFNAKANEKTTHYNLGAYFDDSRLVDGVTITGPEGTFSNWDPGKTDTKRIDYIYSRFADIHSYTTIIDDYDNGITPSDHFCVLVNLTLKKPSEPKNIYVSHDGTDTNDGSISSRVKSLAKALSLARTCDTIRVAEGIYYTGDEGYITRTTFLKVQQSVTIIGGYNNGFTEIVGYSTIDGDYAANDVFDEEGNVVSGNTDNCKWLLYVYKPYALKLENFKLCNAYQDDSSSVKGGGVYSNGLIGEFKNVIFMNNNSLAAGGAIKSTGNLQLECCIFKFNSAVIGGALYLKSPSWIINLVNCSFVSNMAESGPAIYMDSNTDLYIYGTSFINHNASKHGTLSFVDKSINSQITMVNNTLANNALSFVGDDYSQFPGGAAIYYNPADGGKMSLSNNTIVGNICEDINSNAAFNASAVQHVSGSLYLYNNIIAGNYSTSGIGDIRCDNAGIKEYYEKNNLYTSYDNINVKTNTTTIAANDYLTGLSYLTSMFGGEINGLKLNVASTGDDFSTYFISILEPRFGSMKINALTKRDFNEYFMYYMDLDGGKDLFTILEEDQIGQIRNWEGKGTIGAYEYIINDETGIKHEVQEKQKSYYNDGYIYFTDEMADYYIIYDSQGRILLKGDVNENKISVNSLVKGVYFYKLIKTDSWSINQKFVK